MSSHKVPIHLQTPDGFGRFSLRQIFLMGGAIFYVAPSAWTLAPSNGPSLGETFRQFWPGLGMMFHDGSLPIFPIVYAAVAVAPFVGAALPLDPPVEHGTLSAGRWALRHGYRTAEQFANDLGRITVKDKRIRTDYGIGAAWEMPGANMRLADATALEIAEDLWGEFLNGLTGPIQTITISNRIDPEKIVGRIERYAPGQRSLHWSPATNKLSSSPAYNARCIAAWLRDDARKRHLIERRHFLVMHAEDDQVFTDSEIEIEDGLGSLGFRPDQVRRLEGEELRTIIQRTWSPKQPTGKILGPLERPFSASGAIYLDGEWHVALAFGKWPRIARDNALAPLIDGVYDVDVIEHIAPVETDDILPSLERRADAMKFTGGRKRGKAVDDLEDFISALNDGTESPFDVAVLLHIHASDKKTADADAKRIIKRVRRSGAKANRLTWENDKAIQAVAPIGLLRLDRRTKRVDTSSVKRLYPWSASSMWMEDAVPWGETLDSHRPVGWNPWRRPLIANPHLACYMISGGGKGFDWKVWSSRALFAGLTQEFFGFDQAEEDQALGEYGRWAEYCGIEYRHVTAISDFDAALADLDNYKWLGPGICWNIAQLQLRDRPEFFARTKAALWQRATHLPARRQWAVDELWSFVKMSASMAADPHWVTECISAIEDLIRRGRHQQIGGAFFTQRIKDSLEVPVMDLIQGQCATLMYGMQSSGEISDVERRLRWSPADVAAIKQFIPGHALIAAGPWRVAFRCTASDDEYAAFNTDGKLALEDVAPSDEDEDDA